MAKADLELYLNVPTIVLHHSMLWAFPPPDTRLRWGPENWKSDSISLPEAPADDLDFGTSGGMEGVFNLLLEPYPQVRVRSYRIDDVENYADPPINYDHVGTPEATECLETDQGGVAERILSWDFQLSLIHI